MNNNLGHIELLKIPIAFKQIYNTIHYKVSKKINKMNSNTKQNVTKQF